MLRGAQVREKEGKRKKLRRCIQLMYFLYKNEYRIFSLAKNHHNKRTKVKRRKIEEKNQFGL
jgi:hypothetical protein